jgi:hypothetical protein
MQAATSPCSVSTTSSPGEKGNGTRPKNALRASYAIVRVLADGPQHAQLVDAVEGLTQEPSLSKNSIQRVFANAAFKAA